MRAPTFFRPAPPRSALRNVAWTALQSIVIWGVALFAVPLLIVALEGRCGWPSVEWLHAPVVAGILFVACSALNVAAALELALRGEGTPLPTAAPRRLVLGGVYGYVRNPMAVAGIGQALAVGLGFGSWVVLLYAVAGGFVWHHVVRKAEGRDLLTRFGNEYAAYQASVPLWRFRLRRYPAHGR